MLSKENFTEVHIRDLQKRSRRDPILLERTVYAFGLLENFNTLSKTYEKVCRSEIRYRGVEITSADCLWDTISACISIASRGKTDEKDYTMYLRGSRDLRTHIFSENYSAEIAAVRAPRVIYLAACLLVGEPFETLNASTIPELINQKLSQAELMPLAMMRKVNPEGYAYLVKADRLLGKSYSTYHNRKKDPL